MIIRTDTLLNHAWGEDGSPPSYQENGESAAKPFHGCTKFHHQHGVSSLYNNTNQQEEYIYQGSCLGNQGRSPFVDEDSEALNEKGRDNLKDL